MTDNLIFGTQNHSRQQNRSHGRGGLNIPGFLLSDRPEEEGNHLATFYRYCVLDALFARTAGRVYGHAAGPARRKWPGFRHVTGEDESPSFWVLGLDAQVVGDKWVLLSVAGARLTCSGYPPPQWFNFNLRAIARDSTYLGQGQFPDDCFQFNLIDDPLREKTIGGQPTTARTG